MASRKLIVAHRGDRSRARENTVEAFRHAIESGADMIELDVRRTGDAELVVHHDENIGERALAGMDYAEAVRCSEAAGYRVPRFAEVLELTSGRILLDIELKEMGHEQEVLRCVFDSRFHVSDFVITSFEQAALTAVRHLSPGIRIGFLVWAVPAPRALEMFPQTHADFLGPDHMMLDDATLIDAHARGVSLLPWTVNDPAQIARLLQSPAVEGVITDNPVQGLRTRSTL